MTEPTSPASVDPPLHPQDDPMQIIVGQKEGLTLFTVGGISSTLDVLMQLPLPGIVIFVHGVNSDGEWYAQAEEGLCAGLNDRLKRCDQHLCHTGPEAGQLTPAGYIDEIDPDGFLNPNMSAQSFIQSDDSFTPVIRFRWGYKASLEELQAYGDAICLNEQDYWGGGPFANGCSSLPDLWGKGVEEELFLWLHVQHINPTADRQVYACPARPYYVLAAYRLARLVQSIRQKQADVPITIVCHSQGNMIGMAAAFLGDKMPDVTDAANVSGRCVADTYVLCNAPYSMRETNFNENWTERNMKDRQGRSGRQTLAARTQTLAAFFKIVQRQASKPTQDAARIDHRMENKAHGFNAVDDCKTYGYGSEPSTYSTYGRVTLYCNPHDQVISASPVQGIGWRGLSMDEISATNGIGVFSQRVFAQGFTVGSKPERPPGHYDYQHNYDYYDYWGDQYNRPRTGSPDFWQPHSPLAEYSIAKGLEADRNSFLHLAEIATIGLAPAVIIGLKAAGLFTDMHINALPPKAWKIPLQAPPLPVPFTPKAKRFGVMSDAFDQGTDAPGESRDSRRVREAADPYADDRTRADGSTDAAQGDVQSEAALRYQDHATLRMQAKREKLVANDAKVEQEDKPDTATAGYTAWRTEKIKTNLANSIDTHATDHSTIMTNPEHAQKALAYDVAIGCCDIREKDLRQLRIAADWRFVKDLDDKTDPNLEFAEYFKRGKFKAVPVHAWANAKDSPGAMPDTIADERQMPVVHRVIRHGGHP